MKSSRSNTKSELSSDLTADIETRLVDQCSLGAAEFHSYVTSTNDRARALVANSVKTPAVVVAETQTAGRGRGSNPWWACRGALTFSLIIDADAIKCSTAWASLGTAVGVANAIEGMASNVTTALKWPNDIYVANRKVCGVLIESTGSISQHLIVGVGINVNNSVRKNGPSELHSVATSLSDVTGIRMSLADLLLTTVQEIIRSVSGCDARALHAAWQDKCWLTGKSIVVDSGGELYRGECQGVAVDGSLVVDGNDERKQFHSGRITVSH